MDITIRATIETKNGVPVASVADALQSLLEAIEDGDLTADTGSWHVQNVALYNDRGRFGTASVTILRKENV